MLFRSLWVQQLGFAVLPLEALLLLLVLAGSDPGPLPALERLFCWSIGSVAPALLLWRHPADPWSLVLAQIPARGRTDLQKRLASVRAPAALLAGRLLLASLLSLVLLIWCDNHAAAASAFSPLQNSPRVLSLLLAAAVIALMHWQWQQALLSLWRLTLPPERLATQAVAQLEGTSQPLSLGLPLLLFPSLRMKRVATDPPATSSNFQEPATTDSQASLDLTPSSSGAGAAIAIQPDQTAEEDCSADLDQQIL